MENSYNRKELFLECYGKPTRSTYKSYLKRFENALEKDLNKWIIEDEQVIKNDIKQVLVKLKGIPPKSKQTMMNTIKSYLEDNEIELKNKFWKKIRTITKGGPITEDAIPKTEELRMMLHKADVKGKAFILVLASSGMYHGEALKIEERDIYFEYEPTRIIISEDIANKGGRRVTFITNEATYWLKKWLKQKDDYLIHKEQIHNFKWGEIDLEDPRVFCFSPAVSRKIWLRLIKAIGLNQRDPNTKRYIYHIHCLRKYFRTTLGPHMKQDIIETLMGHENSLQKAYRKYTPEKLAKEYLTCENELSILQPKLSEEELIGRLNELEDEKQRQLEKQSIWENKLRFQEKTIEELNKKLINVETILKQNIKEYADPFSPSILTKEQIEYEEKLEKEIIKLREKNLKENLKEDQELVYLDDVPFISKKSKKPYKPTEIDEMFTFIEENKALNYLSNLNDEKLKKLLKDVESIKNSVSSRKYRKLTQK